MQYPDAFPKTSLLADGIYPALYPVLRVLISVAIVMCKKRCIYSFE